MVPRPLIVRTVANGLCFFLLCSVSSAARVRSLEAVGETDREAGEDSRVGDVSAQIIKAQDAEEGDWRLRGEEVHAVAQTSDTKFACRSPEPPTNGFLKAGNFDIGGVVQIFCEQGYILQGPSNITCVFLSLPHFKGGLWVPEEEYSCLRLPLTEEEDSGTELVLDHELTAESIEHEGHHSTCHEPPTPENGYLKGDNFHLEGVVFIYCEEGYSLRGPENITCAQLSPLAPEDGVGWTPGDPYICLRSATEETEIVTQGPEPTQDHPPYKVYNADSDSIPAGDTRTMPGATIPAEEQTDSWVPHRRVVYQLNSNLVEGLDALCALPRVVGPCKAAIPRFFFDTTVMECRPFTYGGGSGNENNFETFKECQFACR